MASLTCVVVPRLRVWLWMAAEICGALTAQLVMLVARWTPNEAGAARGSQMFWRKLLQQHLLWHAAPLPKECSRPLAHCGTQQHCVVSTGSWWCVSPPHTCYASITPECGAIMKGRMLDCIGSLGRQAAAAWRARVLGQPRSHHDFVLDTCSRTLMYSPCSSAPMLNLIPESTLSYHCCPLTNLNICDVFHYGYISRS